MVQVKANQLVVNLESAYSTIDPSKARQLRTETLSTNITRKIHTVGPKKSIEQPYTKRNTWQTQPKIEAASTETAQATYQCHQLR